MYNMCKVMRSLQWQAHKDIGLLTMPSMLGLTHAKALD